MAVPLARPAEPASRLQPRIPAWAQALGLVALTAAAYANTWRVPFLWDDVPAIPENSSLDHLATALHPPPATGVGGRPLLNLSFAVDRWIHGNAVAGYHLANLAIHALAGCLLLTILRRHLPALAAWAAACLWTLHPLQTEAVTYLSQRAESLMGLFYLATLAGFARSTSSRRPWAWQLASVAACAAGMLTKEPMATAPVIVFLYDWTFISASGLAALRQRRWYYAGLASTWLILAVLMRGLGSRGVGIGQGVPVAAYALHSSWSLVHYLRLAFFPYPQVFDYGERLLPVGALTVGCALSVLVALTATARELARRTAAGFGSAWFFLLLLPTTSVVPILAQPTAEHRTYLALAAPVTLAVLALARLLRRPAFAAACAVLVLAAGTATWARNHDYRTELNLWQDTVRKRPGSPRAHFMVGRTLARSPGCQAAAYTEYQAALALDPAYCFALNGAGLILLRRPGGEEQAVDDFGRAAEANPNIAEFKDNLRFARDNWGRALAHSGKWEQAVQQFQAALIAGPDFAQARLDLGIVLAQLRRVPEARTQLELAAEGNDPDAAAAARRVLGMLSPAR